MARITIPTPCHEDIERMSLTERGRFCASCKKNIFDFRKGTQKEFEQIVKAHSQSEVCGIVPSQWLNPSPQTRRVSGTILHRLQIFALSFLVVFGPELMGIGNVAKAEIKTEILNHFDLFQNGEIGGGIKVKGRVVDEYDNTPAEGAMINLIHQGNYVQRTVVDGDGYFELVIPKEWAKQEDWSIEVDWLGKRFNIRPDLQDEGILTLTVQAEIMLPEVEIVSRPSRHLTGAVTAGVTVTEYVGITAWNPDRLSYYWRTERQWNRFQPTIEERLLMFSSEVNSKDL